MMLSGQGAAGLQMWKVGMDRLHGALHLPHQHCKQSVLRARLHPCYIPANPSFCHVMANRLATSLLRC
jgi:hypothetical protein